VILASYHSDLAGCYSGKASGLHSRFNGDRIRGTGQQYIECHLEVRRIGASTIARKVATECRMRLLTVRHVTIYPYVEPVKLGEHRMMFRPRESHDLRLVRTQLIILPHPVQLRWLHDVFDNSVAVATFAGETTRLYFESTVTLEHTEVALPDYQLEAGAAAFPFNYSAEDQPDLVRALERSEPSEEVDRWASGMLPRTGRRATMELLRTMTLRIQDEFAYSHRGERGVQSPGVTIRRGRGTCRDFAWLMIDAVRSLGLAVRFVSGYIFVPNTASTNVVGGGSTHAWLQVYLPGAGWVDFDPTNSIVGNRNLIRVAVAWHPASVLPLWGTFTGVPGSALNMQVDVAVTEEFGSNARPASRAMV
jgi:transglutaminase-like putative cysteine protease